MNFTTVSLPTSPFVGAETRDKFICSIQTHSKTHDRCAITSAIARVLSAKNFPKRVKGKQWRVEERRLGRTGFYSPNNLNNCGTTQVHRVMQSLHVDGLCCAGPFRVPPVRREAPRASTGGMRLAVTR